jgi:hypothetical protein
MTISGKSRSNSLLNSEMKKAFGAYVRVFGDEGLLSPQRAGKGK